MSGGSNARLWSQKRTFLENNAVQYTKLEYMPSEAGLVRVDIAPSTYGNTGLVVHEIRAYASRDKAASKHATNLTAHWLPWASKKAVYVDLDDTAQLFLTSEINGCTIRVGRPNNERTTPLRVIHVAGDSPNSAKSEGSKWRNEKGEALGLGQSSRRFSSGGLMGESNPSNTGYPGSGELVGYGDRSELESDADWHNVIGFNMGNGDWRIFSQSVKFTEKALVPIVQQIWPPNV